MTRVEDTLGRPLRNLRISVTDRCNLRCQYCMPEEEYAWLPRAEILHFGEIAALVDVFTGLGVDKVRLTGGEPLLRRELPRLVRMLAAKPALRDLAVTTNGLLLTEQAAALREAGLHRVTVSLDTLRPDRFAALTRRPSHAQVLEGIAAVPRAGFAGTKLDTVVIRGLNDDELADLVEFAKAVPAELRFIEYMDVGGATRWSLDQVVSRSRSSRTARRRPTATGCRTARSSGSSPPRPSRSAPGATGAGSPPTARGISASTRPRAWTCAARSGPAPARRR